MQGRADRGRERSQRAETPLERLFRAHDCALRLRERAQGPDERAGTFLDVDPAWGRGSYWRCPVDDEMAVFSYDLVLPHEENAACLAPDYFSVSAQRRSKAGGRGADPAADGAHRAEACHGAADGGGGVCRREGRRQASELAMAPVVGYAWKGQSFVPTPRKGERLQVVGFVLLPRALQRMSLRCQCDPLVLSGAIAALDGTKAVPGLSSVLEDVAKARPSAVVARAYYESKITEAVSLIVDWSLTSKGARRVPLRAFDRTALNRARRHLADNLDRTVSTEELCEVACMSASKLTGLFKAAEGVTPQEYARALRMELACKLLSQTDLPLSAIALQLGFQRQGSFSEAFKDRYHITPRDFRNLANRG